MVPWVTRRPPRGWGWRRWCFSECGGRWVRDETSRVCSGSRTPTLKQQRFKSQTWNWFSCFNRGWTTVIQTVRHVILVIKDSAFGLFAISFSNYSLLLQVYSFHVCKEAARCFLHDKKTLSGIFLLRIKMIYFLFDTLWNSLSFSEVLVISSM